METAPTSGHILTPKLRDSKTMISLIIVTVQINPVSGSSTWKQFEWSSLSLSAITCPECDFNTMFTSGQISMIKHFVSRPRCEVDVMFLHYVHNLSLAFHLCLD